MRRRTGLGLVVLLAAAAPPPPGATGCSGCHGAAMPIAGHNAKDLTAALTEFRAGARPSTVMERIAKGFDARELSAIATWWAERQ